MMLPLQIAAAATARQFYPSWAGMPDPGLMRYVAAGCELMAQAQLTHHRPAFSIDRITIGGRSVAVREETVKTLQFCTLLHFAKEVPVAQPRVLLVAPLSGHFATLLRGTVRTMLADHDVYVTDWKNARDVNLTEGEFGIDDFIDYVPRTALGAGAGIEHRLQHSLTQRRRQRPAKLRRGKAIKGRGHRAARNPQRSSNRPVCGTAFVLEAQDLSYASHRHSLGWHRSPRSSFLRRAESRAPPSGRAIATPQGWPTSNRNGRDQIGIGGRLHSGISGRLPPEYAFDSFDFDAVPVVSK